MPSLIFESVASLFEDGQGITKDLLKADVLEKFKLDNLAGTSDSDLRITFSSDDDDDILVEKIDPEKALGYSVYGDEKEYFNQLSASLYEPSEEDILGGIDG